MAKTFGTGADPKGLVNRGVEGSGAAQIFRPSQAVQDFVTGQRQQGLQKQKQKQAEAKAKEEKLKLQRQEFDKLKEVELSSFSLNDQKNILVEYGDFLNMAAQKQANGIDINRDPEVLAGKQALLLKSEAFKFQKQNYDKAMTALYNLSKDPNANKEQVVEYANAVQNYYDAPMEERDDLSIVPPAVEKILDYEKAVSEAVKNVGGDKKPIIDERTGAIITTIEVPQSEIENTVKYFQTTPAYKQKTKSLLQNGVFQNEEDAKEFLDENLKIRFRTQKSATKGDVGSGYGDGAASTYRAEYENIRPSDINIESYGLTPSEAMNMGFSKPLSITEKPYLRSIDISSSPKKAPVPLTIESNIKYKLDGKEYALTSNDPIIPSRLVEYNTLDGTTKYLFLFNIKGTGNAAAVIDSGNKEVFERYFLKKGKTIEDYLNEGEKTKNVNATPKQPTAPKAETNTPKTPNRTIDLSKFDKSKK